MVFIRGVGVFGHWMYGSIDWCAGFHPGCLGLLWDVWIFPRCRGVLEGTGVTYGGTGLNPFCVTDQPSSLGYKWDFPISTTSFSLNVLKIVFLCKTLTNRNDKLSFNVTPRRNVTVRWFYTLFQQQRQFQQWTREELKGSIIYLSIVFLATPHDKHTIQISGWLVTLLWFSSVHFQFTLMKRIEGLIDTSRSQNFIS